MKQERPITSRKRFCGAVCFVEMVNCGPIGRISGHSLQIPVEVSTQMKPPMEFRGGGDHARFDVTRTDVFEFCDEGKLVAIRILRRVIETPLRKYRSRVSGGRDRRWLACRSQSPL